MILIVKDNSDDQKTTVMILIVKDNRDDSYC